jgi:hypothetical protein
VEERGGAGGWGGLTIWNFDVGVARRANVDHEYMIELLGLEKPLGWSGLTMKIYGMWRPQESAVLQFLRNFLSDTRCQEGVLRGLKATSEIPVPLLVADTDCQTLANEPTIFNKGKGGTYKSQGNSA